MLFALMMTGFAQGSEIEDDILLFAPAATSTYIPYNLSQVAVYLGDLLALTEGFETAGVAVESSAASSLLKSYVNPDYKAGTIASVTAGYRHVILLDNHVFSSAFPEMAFEGTYQLSKTILRAGSTPLLLMGATPYENDMEPINENTYRIANGCGIHLIPAGVGAKAAETSFAIPSLNDDRTSYLVASMIYSQITGQSASSVGYEPESGGSPISEATELSDLAETTQASEFAQTQYSTDIGNEGVIRYRTLAITNAPFSGRVRYIYSGTSTENGTSDRLSDIISETYNVGKLNLGRTQDLSLSVLTAKTNELAAIEDEAAFIYVRRSDISADTVRSYNQTNVLPIIYDRPFEYGDGTKNTVESTRNPLRTFTNWLDYYLGQYQTGGWNFVGFHSALGRFYELEPTLIATTDGTHMSDPLYYMLASQILTSALGTELPPPADLSGQALVGYQVGQEFIKQVAHLSEDGAFTPDSRLRVIESTPPLTEPGVFYSLQLQSEEGGANHTWEVDPDAPLPDGLSLSSTGLISGTPTAFFNSQIVVVKVTDADGAFRKAALKFFSPPNPIPVAEPDTALATNRQPVSIDVLANDVDADGLPSPLSLVSVSSPNWGSAEIVSGEIVYTPESNLSSRDTFTYTITDGENFGTGSIDVLHHSGYVWIPLDEDSGSNVSDAHGTSVGTMINFANVESAHVEGVHGNALTFDGSNDQVVLNDLQPLPLGSSPRTVMCWMRTPAAVPAESQGLFGYGKKAGGQRILLRLFNPTNTIQQFALDIWGSKVIGNTDLADNEWHHVAAVCEDVNGDGTLRISECKLYVDGVAEAAEIPGNASRIVNTVVGDPPVIGGGNITSKANFGGAIDDVRIFPVALSSNEVAAYANGTADAAPRWHLEHFGNASAIWTAEDDSDHLNRLAEYAFGGNPASADAPDFGYELRFNPDTGKLEASFNRRQAGTHRLNYLAEASPDLIDWETLTTTQIASNAHPTLPGFDRVTFETDNDTTSLPRQFLRLRIVEQ